MFCERKMFTLSEDVIMPDIGVVEKAGTDVMLGIEAGDALRLARKQFIEQFGEKTLAWASYLLYGDSTFSCSMPEAYAYPSQKSPKTIVIDC